jgi:AraC-like DNA-binding protein
MPNAPSPRFSSALVPFVFSYLRMSGHDPDPLARKFLPPGAQVVEGPTTISVSAFRNLLETAAKQVGDPLFGLHLAAALPRGAYGLLEFALRSAPTARAALEQLVRYGALINPAARFWLEPTETEVALHHRLPEDPKGVGRHGNLFTVARLYAIGKEMVGDRLKPGRVWFAHTEKSCPPEVVEFFGTDRIEFGRSSNGLTFDIPTLEAPLPGADPALNVMLREHANRMLGDVDPEGIHERTRKAITALLPHGEVSLGAVAKKLHLSERTLQRRLTEDGVPFGSLVTEIRGESARRYLLEDELPVAEVALRVGYQDAAAFIRAFKRWTGQTPGAWRAAQAA